MICEKVTKHQFQEEIHLRAVHGNGEENKSYAEATPSAALSMTITNKEALGSFIPGGEYYIDISPAKVAEALPDQP